MSRRRDVRQRLVSLGDIDNILGAIKSLAFMEIHKLSEYLVTQARVVTNIEASLADCLHFHLNGKPPAGQVRDIHLLIGSERGLCGNFNEQLVEAAAHLGNGSGVASLVAVGKKLCSKLEKDPRVLIQVDGPSVVEEVEGVLVGLVGQLQNLQENSGLTALGLTALYHGDEAGTIRVRRLLPLPDLAPPSPGFSHPPLINLPPLELLSGLTSQYLYAVLHEIFFSSLMVENKRRLEHMDTAIHRLDDMTAKLKLRYNALRQEEIIEEIEVIMLSIEALAESP